MDPLVRAALGVQQLVARGTGILLSLSLGVYLVCWAADAPPAEYNLAAFAVWSLSSLVHLVRRLRRIQPEAALRLDVELFSSLITGAYALVLHTPGSLSGPYYPLLYALMMLMAAFAHPAAALIAVGYATLLEAGLHYVAHGQAEAGSLPVHAAMLGLFAFLNVLLFRAEIARVRRLSRQRIDGELQRMKQAARSYRLLAAPSSAHQSSRDTHNNQDRLLQSSVDEINEALKFALDLLRQTLSLRTAVLLGLDDSGGRLHIQELSTEEDRIAQGPFNAKDGILAAVLARGDVIALAGDRAATHTPYYTTRLETGAVCAIPVMERGTASGVLLVDRREKLAFSESDQEALRAATHFILRVIENERVFGQLERAKIEQGKLYRASEALGSATTEVQVIEAGVSSAREFAAFDFAVVTLFDRNGNEHEVCAASGEGTEALVGQRFRHNAGLVSMVVANRHALPYRGEYDAQRQVVFSRGLKPPAVPSLLVLPLVVHERALGTLVLGSKRRGTFTDAVRPTLEVLASHIAVSLANARMLKRLEELATTDGLTGLYNKRALIETAEQKLRSAQRFKKPLSLLICDIDHFKRVNDTYGHDVGDLVIRGFGDLLKRVKRDIDLVGRFGGEEFVIVCEETEEGGAKLLAERIRSELKATCFQTELGPLSVTCSVGVSTFPQAGTTWDTLFKATDEALYASKRGGRDRVTLWTSKLQGAA